MVIAMLLDPDRRYSSREIEDLISKNVRSSVLEQRGFAPDHIRRAMIENGYAERDEITNETWIAKTFTGIPDVHGPRIAFLMKRLDEAPGSTEICPECGRTMKVDALLRHYQKRHAGEEPWEKVVSRYFGY